MKNNKKSKSAAKSPARPSKSPARPSKSPARPFQVVGIGASAGGLEAFKQLFKHLPADTGMAYVLVQHLSPQHSSMLSEIIQGSAKMPVREVTRATRLEPNHVYVIPPNANLTLSQGFLNLQAVTAAHGRNLPVDFFFESLASDMGPRAIGVILSGTASDGAKGLRAIRDAGGITLVQDPEGLEYSGMPQAAIAAGAAHYIIPLQQIAEQLVRMAKAPTPPSPPPQGGPSAELSKKFDNEPGLKRLFLRIRQRTKVDFSLYKDPTIYRRISRRMDMQRTKDFGTYLKYVESHPAEIDALHQDLLINVTGFFRDGEVFDILKTRIFPEILKNKTPDEPLKIWVPGCSTGEEVYSLVIALHEFLGDAAESRLVLVYGTDVSEVAISKARRGVYPDDIIKDVPPERLRRFFIKEDGQYRLIRSVRERCIFSTQNVASDPPIGKLDLLSCRNLMIYLRPELQERVLTTFHYALNPGGFLVLGSSEGIGSMARLFYLYDKMHKIYVKKEIQTRPRLELPAEQLMVERIDTPRVQVKLPPPSARARRDSDVASEADRVILTHYVPAGILVNRDMEILQFRGSTGRYLEGNQGPASLNLMKMAREGLMPDLRLAIHRAARRNGVVRKQGLRIRSNGHMRNVNIEVVPVTPQGGETHYLILFSEPQENFSAESRGGRGGRGGRGKAGKRSRKSALDGEMDLLKEELATSRASLQSLMEDHDAMKEELQSSNEEVLSSNEELQSTNEELETAKEELQSSNEELTTMNDELTHRNEELSKVNDDLNNLLSSFHIPIVIVGRDLSIRRFTPAAGKLMNLIATDIDRPITNIKPNLRVDDLEALLRDVIDNMSAREADLQDIEGHWYSLRVRPYQTSERKIDGAVMILVDIDALKKGG